MFIQQIVIWAEKLLLGIPSFERHLTQYACFLGGSLPVSGCIYGTTGIQHAWHPPEHIHTLCILNSTNHGSLSTAFSLHNAVVLASPFTCRVLSQESIQKTNSAVTTTQSAIAKVLGMLL